MVRLVSRLTLKAIMSGVAGVLLLSWLPLAMSQTPVASEVKSEPQFSPQAAYDKAIRPLEITRRAVQNWSEIELSALKIARENAKTACAAFNPDQPVGEDLLALARLCAFAQLWQPVHQAAANYIAAAQNAKPESSKASVDLATAYDYSVQASLNLKSTEDAILTCQTMLRAVPYDVFTSEATTSTIESIRFIQSDQALALLNQRQSILLSQIKAQGSPSANSPNSVAQLNLDPPLPLHVLYADALALALLQQFSNQPKAAAGSYAELESALPGSISSEDAMYIGERRRQYLLLGAHLPTLNPMGWLVSPGAAAPPNLNTWFANATVFLLFPDWCNQCVAMGYDSASKASELRDAYQVRFFPLIAQANPPEKHTQQPPKKVPLPASKPGNAVQAQSERLHVQQELAIKSTPDSTLEGTQTIVVPNETLDSFAATDFPLLIVTDRNGIIRWMQRASETAFSPGGDVQEVVKHILATWPPEASESK
jgi:hypothetical protein